MTWRLLPLLLLAACTPKPPPPPPVAACKLAPLAIAGREAALPHGRADFGEPDSPTAPTAWQGPLKITRTEGGACAAEDAVSLIAPPTFIDGDRALLVSTYSGSNQRLFLVGQSDCRTLWASPVFSGPVSVQGAALKAGDQTFQLDADCRPRP